jgi:hypothetical protein
MVRAPGQAAASRFSFLVGIVTVTRTSQPLVRVASRGQLGQQRVAALIIPQFHYFSMIAPVTAPCGPLPGRTSDERAATAFATQRLKTGKVVVNRYVGLEASRHFSTAHHRPACVNVCAKPAYRGRLLPPRFEACRLGRDSGPRSGGGQIRKRSLALRYRRPDAP